MSYEDYDARVRHKLQTKKFKLEKIDLDIERLKVEKKKIEADIVRMEESLGSS